MATALPGTGVPVSTDPITTLNGAAATASEVIQRVKLSTGAAGTATDVSAANPLPMSIASDADNIASGTLAAAAQTVVLNVATKAGAAVQLSGTWVGTVAFEGTIDGTIWTTVNAVAASTSTPQPTTTVNGLYRLTPSGLSQVRANMTAFTSGAATVSMRSGGGAGGIYANQILPTKITDGVSTATIKAASTAAAATDSPLVVTIHPSTATQPVSMATAPSTPVTNVGTFAVQAAATLAAETTKVIGTVNIAAAQTIAVTNAGTFAVQAAATLAAETTKVIGAVNIATAPAVAKGTQGANAVPTQDLKDSGRVSISLTAEFSPAAVAETMLTMSVSKDGAAITTGSSYIITAGKRLRIASKSITVENTLGASIQRAYLRARFAATGGALTTSPLQSNCVAAAAATVKSVGTNFDDYPDGMEFLGDGTRAIGWSLQAPDWVTASATLKVYVTIVAFEY